MTTNDKRPEHTLEPWIVKEGGFIGPSNKPSVAQILSSGTQQGDDIGKSNARHIVACVNYCAQLKMTTEQIEEVIRRRNLILGGNASE